MEGPRAAGDFMEDDQSNNEFNQAETVENIQYVELLAKMDYSIHHKMLCYRKLLTKSAVPIFSVMMI